MAGNSQADGGGDVKKNLPPYSKFSVCPECGCVLVRAELAGDVVLRECEKKECGHIWEEAAPENGEL